ncbi:MAG: response regulator [Spirochaetes bacterium]|nr:response regulator [Spirochaetota bacterium]MBU0956457.1 response regulator [Spirochaetota bacterium]
MISQSLPFWLSRAATIIIAIYIYAAYRTLRLNSRGLANRLAAIINSVFAIWAFAAIFWFSAETAEAAQWWYSRFSWTWCIFPPLVLHFNLVICGNSVISKSRWRYLILALIYTPAAVLMYLTPTAILAPPLYRMNHWTLTVNYNWQYYFFVGHYVLLILLGIIFVVRARHHSRNNTVRARLAVIALSSFLAIAMGFLTDGIFIMLQIDFPNLAIFWTLLLSLGMLMAMTRFGFLSPLPLTETPRILNALADMVIFLDESARIVWANNSSIESIGYKSIDDVKGKSIHLFLSGKEAGTVEETAKGSLDFYTARTQWGANHIPVNIRSRSLMDLNQIRGAIVTAMDISISYALEKAEHAAADSGLLFNEFIEHSLDGIILTDADGSIDVWNAPMVSITGLSAQEVAGTKIWDTLSRLSPENKRTPQDAIGMKRSVVTALLGSSSPWTSKIFEQTIARPDGQLRILQSSSFIIPLHTGAISATISRDITDSRRAAEEMIERIRKLDHAQKMDAVGSLTGGIAHDFNNTLGGIVGSISLIKMGVEDGSYTKISDIERELNIIDRSASRASASVARLLTLTKKKLPETQTFKLKDVIKRVSDFASRSMDKAVTIELPKEGKEALVSGDPGLIEQLLLNLYINAEHSMTIMRPAGEKRGGCIIVDLRRFKPDQAFLAINPAAHKQDYWCISIQDEGVGIPHHILPHIFDPFYSTKPSEKSNGLGLAMAHSIASQHGGFINVKSERGKGSTFMVFLPIAEAHEVKEEKHRQIKRGSGLIMLVDDDEVLRDTAQVMLGALGYQTEVAISGEEAIELFKENPQRWQAVIMDVRMSGISGDEAATYLRSINPDIPIIMASGYISDETLQATRNQPNMAFIQKPYTVETLSEALGIAIN